MKNFCEGLFFFLRSPEKFCDDLSLFFLFFWRALALVSLVLGLGLEHSCPWPRECLSSERLSLALASDFFLCPWPWPRALCPRLHLCELSSTVIYRKHKSYDQAIISGVSRGANRAECHTLSRVT